MATVSGSFASPHFRFLLLYFAPGSGTMSDMTRSLFIVVVFVAFFRPETVFPDAPPGWEPFPPNPEQRTDWDRFGGTARTRFGNTPVDRFPDVIESEHPRHNPGFRLGSNNSFLGIDANVRSSRFFTPPDVKPLLPSDYLGQRVVPRPDEDGSANTIAPVARADTSRPIQRPPNFFDRPGIMEPPAVVSEAELDRLPGQQRWFRDIGRRPTLADMPGNPTVPPDASGSGEAFAVGGELLSAPGAPGPGIVEHSVQVNPVVARRQFEQILENQLLSASSVHLLSPVQVSYQNGVVTVRGIVASQTDKIAVGNILLQNPNVKQVNNLISVVSRDPSEDPGIIEAMP